MLKRSKVWLTVGVLLALVLMGTIGLAQFFGIRQYPGGYLKLVYRMEVVQASQPATSTIEITPTSGGLFKVTSLSESLAKQEEVQLGLFGIGFFRLGFGFRSEGTAIDLTPLNALADATVEPKKTYLLPDGAKFEGGEQVKIAGIDAIRGIYTHPDFANQRVQLAIVIDLAIRKLLPI